MNKTLTLCGALLTLPLAASTAEIKGDAQLDLGYTWLNGSALNTGGPEADEYPDLRGEVRFGWDCWDDNYFVQYDIFGEHTFEDDDSAFKSGLGGAFHLLRKNDDISYGVFGGVVWTEQNVFEGSDESSTRFFGGLEAIAFKENNTFYAQLGYLDGSGGSDGSGKNALRRAVFARGVARHFFNEGFMFEGDLSGAVGVSDEDANNTNVISWGISTEYQFTDRISGIAGYKGFFGEQSREDDRLDTHTFYVACKFFFDKGSLKERERNGVALDTPDFLHWVGFTSEPME